MMRRQPSEVMTFFGLCLLAVAVLHLDCCTAHEIENGSFVSHMKHLHDYLLKDYRTSIRPVSHSGDTVTVNLKMKFMAIEDLDEKNQAFRPTGYMYQSWMDVGLAWNPADFVNIDTIRIPVTEIWRPDVTILNSKSAYFYPPINHPAIISSNGKVMWFPPMNIETHCELDLSEFPFDEHVCRVIFVSWTHYASGVNLTSSDGSNSKGGEMRVEANSENQEWELKRVTVERHELTYENYSGVYPEIIYSFTIKRRSTFTTHLFVGPSVILCIVTPVVFLLPPGSGEKVMFGIGVLIADTLLLGQLINYIPTAHPNIPLIAKYFLANIVMAALSLAISAIIVGFWDKSTTRMTGPPAFFRLLVLEPLGTLFCVKKDDLLHADEPSGAVQMEVIPDGENDEPESTSAVDPATEKKRRFMANYLRNAARSEWRQLAVIFDRLFFVIYCVILAILTLSFARFM